MSKSQAYKSQSRPGSASTQVAGPSLVKTMLGVAIVLILLGVSWIGWNLWQTRLAPAASNSSVSVTNAPVASQLHDEDDTAPVQPVALSPQTVPLKGPQSGGANINVPPIALADIPGNVATGQPAPDFTVRTMGGGKFALADHAGQPTMIMFSASWCASCLFEAQNLGQVYARYKDRGLNIVMLDLQSGDTDAELQVFREAAGNPDYVWAFDDDYAVAQAFEVTSLDTTVLMDQSGKIVYRDEYPTPLEPLLQAVAGVLP
jgi:peroxiredoxin